MTGLQVTLAIPYRGGQVDREVAFAYTRQHLAALLPGVRTLVVDTAHQPYNRAAARNEAVRQAGPGVVVVCDADSLPEQGPLLEAIETAGDGVLHLPYTVFRGLTREHTLAVLLQGAQPAEGEPALQLTSSVGGIMVIDHDAYWDAGGQDEQFNGWGGEDTAFRYACDALLGDLVRHDGTLHGLWHPPSHRKQSAQHRANLHRMNRYKGARNSPRVMRQLIDARTALAG